MKPTEQQEYAIQAAKQCSLLKIDAVAGSGKTSTLVMVANELALPSIYVAFNKVTATEAAEKFPTHVACRTTHSLAYAVFGAQLQHKLSRPKGKYVNVAGTGSEIARYYKLDGVEGVATANAMGMFVKATVERFEQSASMSMTDSHVPKHDMKKVIAADSSSKAYVLKYAKMLWNDRCNVDKGVLATHDTYMKLWQMSKPILPFEILYLDEAQDTTPCVLDVVLNQKHMKTILVGDRRQAIYGWRGASNAMAEVKGTVAQLSMSFRYGVGIAEVATAILHNDMIISGRADLDSVIGYNVVDRTKPYMYLFRTNTMLLMEAVAAIDKGEKVKVEIDVKDFIKILQSAQALHSSVLKDVKHERILPYAKWSAMVEEANEIGGELKRLVAIVEGRSAEHIISVLEGYHAPSDAIATYTTAHKAKGRECQQVILADDYPTNYSKGEWKGTNEAEENLLYVAATRSQRVLEINKSVEEVLEKYDIPFVGNSPHVQTYIDEDVSKLMKQEAKMVRSIIHDELPF